MFDLSKLSVVDDNEGASPVATTDNNTEPQKQESSEDSSKQIEINPKSSNLIEGIKPIEDEEFESFLEEREKENPTPKHEGDKVKKQDNAEASVEDTFKALAGYLKEKEIFSNVDLENFSGTEEEFIEAVQQEFFEGPLESYKQSLHPTLRYLMDNWEEGVPLDELINITSNEIRYNSIDESKVDDDVNLQKAILTAYLRETAPKWSEERINREVNKKVELGEVDDVKEALSELKVLEQQKAQELVELTKNQKAQAEKEAKENYESFRKMTFETKEIIPGVALSQKEQEKIFKAATTPIGYMGNRPVSKLEGLLSDPKNVIKINWLLEETKDLTDFSTLEKTIQTKVNKKIEKLIDNSKPTSASVQTPEISKNLNSIDSLKSIMSKLKK
jgi:hypothetical protein